MFDVYILYSKVHDRYYVGQCEDLQKRLLRHNNKQVTSTKRFVPWILVYSENYPTRAKAVQRETYIKSMKSRNFIETLLAVK